MAVLRRIAVDRFRNLKDINITFDPEANLIVGDNGSGKSNLLEAINYLFYLRSYRNAIEEELIAVGEDGFTIEGEDEDRVASIRLVDGTKKVELNGIERKRYSDYAGWLDCVVFSLTDIWIIRGSPYQRRNWLDSLMIRTRSGYYRNLVEYRNILKQRNQLLLQKRNDRELEAWTERLIKIGRRIYQLRQGMFPNIKEYYRQFAEMLDLDTTIDYQPATTLESFENDITNSRKKELEVGQTIIGPHRDELMITKNGYRMRGYGSEGEQRLGVIILRLVEGKILKEERKAPILLLDEPLIEIDKTFKEKIENLLKGRGQTIMASTADIFYGKKFYISGGKVETTG